ncbi:MAG: hypothetical protein ABSG40_22695 [Terriglobales bacterium]
MALAGAFFVIGYTRANHKQQHVADLDNLEVHRQLITAQQQSATASQTATQGAIELTRTTGQLATITQQLAHADQELADSKERLQRVEAQQRWRTLTRQQRKKMIAILSKWKGNGIFINPFIGDNEVHEFANEIDSVFKQSGWQTGWAEEMIVPNQGGMPLSEGLELHFARAETLPTETKQIAAIEKDLIDAVSIADPVVKITHDQPNPGVHLVIGRKRRAPTRSPQPAP